MLLGVRRRFDGEEIGDALKDIEGPRNDKPITEPTDDRFGIDPFAKALAASIRKMRAPEGTVIALNGPWGSGKSSAVNLILHHLTDAIENDEIAVVNFACWWFRGEEALALAFFRELYAGLGPSLGDQFRKVLPKIGARLLRAGSVVSAGADLAGARGIGSVAAGTMSWFSDLIHAEDTVEKLHADLTKVLGEQKKRFLIVIDDIDRLSPDEALLIFRLVKSIGRLPNVIYLLVFDRYLAEAIVSERYPSEGPHYLEKMIQAGFDIPEPRQVDLNHELLRQVEAICGSPTEDSLVRFMNVFYDVIAPEIRTPRDLTRLTNALSVTWPGVGSEVDVADFIGVETLRLFRPGLYRAVRGNKERLCGTGDRYGRSGRDQKAEIDALMLGSVDAKEHERLRRALMRLFPRLESVWSNMNYGGDSASQWARQRFVCSSEHFESYFRFSIGDDVLPRREIDALIARASDSEFIKQKLREALTVTRKDGKTKAMLILDELNRYAANVSDEDVEPLLAAIFELGDDLDVESDKAGAFRIGDNQLRIHWLLRRLTLDRFDLATRSALFMAAIKRAALGWLVHFSQSSYQDYHPREGKSPEPEENCLTTELDAEALRHLSLGRLRSASQCGELVNSNPLAYLMFAWRELANDDGAEVKAWTVSKMNDDAAIALFAKAFTSYSWSQGLGMAGLGDRVAKRTTRAGIDSIDKILDKDAFRARVEEVAAKNEQEEAGRVVREFLAAWKRRDENPRD
ncbi:NTPase [Rhodopseudomonas palustris]|uniref:NTPase n=1 Tax=Rhodopseudomonas palustris TaxID=1076 RepID=A0A323U8V3_RHOPL|nr:P-loop NTPase fold protein [Rhodopseudomonas palustris]PZA09204.1 NTPase [Rhodopseudomonas palustris]